MLREEKGCLPAQSQCQPEHHTSQTCRHVSKSGFDHKLGRRGTPELDATLMLTADRVLKIALWAECQGSNELCLKFLRGVNEWRATATKGVGDHGVEPGRENSHLARVVRSNSGFQRSEHVIAFLNLHLGEIACNAVRVSGLASRVSHA